MDPGGDMDSYNDETGIGTPFFFFFPLFMSGGRTRSHSREDLMVREGSKTQKSDREKDTIGLAVDRLSAIPHRTRIWIAFWFLSRSVFPGSSNRTTTTTYTLWKSQNDSCLSHLLDSRSITNVPRTHCVDSDAHTRSYDPNASSFTMRTTPRILLASSSSSPSMILEQLLQPQRSTKLLVWFPSPQRRLHVSSSLGKRIIGTHATTTTTMKETTTTTSRADHCKRWFHSSLLPNNHNNHHSLVHTFRTSARFQPPQPQLFQPSRALSSSTKPHEKEETKQEDGDNNSNQDNNNSTANDDDKPREYSIPELTVDAAKHKAGMMDPERPSFQNPLHYDNPDMQAEFEHEYKSKEEFEANIQKLPPLAQEGEQVPIYQDVKDLVDECLHLTMLEMHELTNRLQDHYGFDESAYEPQQQQGEDGGPEEEEEDDDAGSGGAAATKTTFDIKLVNFDAKSKIKLIKEVRGLAGLGLKEAKELVDTVPSIIQKDVKQERAEELKAKLEELGATIEIE